MLWLYPPVLAECSFVFVHFACTRCIFIEVYYALVSYFSSIFPPRPANRRNRAVTMDPKSLMLAQLNALSRNSLILLASARNLVTVGTRSRLAHRIFEHEHANNPAPQAIAPHLPASTENPGVSMDPEPPSHSTVANNLPQLWALNSRLTNLASFVS